MIEINVGANSRITDCLVAKPIKVFESNGLTIFCDINSWLYVRGIEVDFSDDMLNGGFKINNPNANRSCGCGTSFSV